MQIVLAKSAARWIWAKYSTKKDFLQETVITALATVGMWHHIILQYIFYIFLKFIPQKVKLSHVVGLCTKSSLLMIVNDCWHGFVYITNVDKVMMKFTLLVTRSLTLVYRLNASDGNEGFNPQQVAHTENWDEKKTFCSEIWMCFL